MLACCCQLNKVDAVRQLGGIEVEIVNTFTALIIEVLKHHLAERISNDNVWSVHARNGFIAQGSAVGDWIWNNKHILGAEHIPAFLFNAKHY